MMSSKTALLGQATWQHWLSCLSVTMYGFDQDLSMDHFRLRCRCMTQWSCGGTGPILYLAVAGRVVVNPLTPPIIGFYFFIPFFYFLFFCCMCESNSGFNFLEPGRGLWDGGRQRASAGLLHRPKPQPAPESRYEKW